MLSNGQKIFTFIFFVVFVVVIGFQYYKDSKKNKDLFKGTFWIIVVLIAVMVSYVLINKLVN